MLTTVIILGILSRCVIGQYPSPGDTTATDQDVDSASSDRMAPVAPPRVPAIDRPSFGYRPPPPPMRRDAKSAGQCTFDQNLWRFEPQTAIANAVMFDRTTGFSCEECIDKCLKYQVKLSLNCTGPFISERNRLIVNSGRWVVHGDARSGQ
ncbi:unnamed protein product [Gongylonema pulchrum]|uniref:Gnk2-homologous domain-containing protein n=1 Tax=Gongylonema pulchrum TaxID=637853 RepID=A0A183CU75_9BILA|nr:unnamed protein product [Gongylonema pulchrum]